MLAKRFPNYSFGVIHVLAGGMDEADAQFSSPVAAMDDVLRSPNGWLSERFRPRRARSARSALSQSSTECCSWRYFGSLTSRPLHSPLPTATRSFPLCLCTSCALGSPAKLDCRSRCGAPARHAGQPRLRRRGSDHTVNMPDTRLGGCSGHAGYAGGGGESSTRMHGRVRRQG